MAIAPGAVLLNGCIGLPGARRYRPLGGLIHYALSPDGAVLAAIQEDVWNTASGRRRLPRLILSRWREGTGTILPLPEDYQLRNLDSPFRRFSDPEFSPDGKTLVMVRLSLPEPEGSAPVSLQRSLVLFDLADQSQRSLPTPPSIELWGPRFSPDGRRLAFFTRSNDVGLGVYGEQLLLMPVAGGTARSLLPLQFRFPSRVCFRGSHELLFTALQVDGSLSAEAEALGYTRFTAMTFALQPTASGPFAVQLERPQPDDRWPGAAPSFLCASGDGSVLAWIGRTDPGNERFAYDAFERRNGQVTRLSNLRTYAYGCAISRDASAVAFAEGDANRQEFDLTVVDTRSLATIRTGLLAQARRLPASPEPIRWTSH